MTQEAVIFGVLGDEADVPPQIIDEVRGAGIPFFRSPERGLRALARIPPMAGRSPRVHPPAAARVAAPALPAGGLLPELAAKPVSRHSAFRCPRRAGARSRAAQAVAAAVGYPVALKLQSRQLAHKSDIGGVILGVTAQDLPAAWCKLDALARDRGLVLERRPGRGDGAAWLETSSARAAIPTGGRSWWSGSAASGPKP